MCKNLRTLFIETCAMVLILLAISSSALIGSASETHNISGSGSGELLLTIKIRDSSPVFSGNYNYDLLGIHIPPIEAFNVTSTKKGGYSYTLPGISIPGKPNDFTVTASGVKDLNIGLKKLQGSYMNSTTVWKDKYTRVWITSQIHANKNGVAITTSDLLSPGSYDVKIFGDAANNTTQVNLTMSLVKKIVVNGRFNLSINTTGFPSGNYSIAAKALNGTFRLDEIKLEGLSTLE